MRVTEEFATNYLDQMDSEERRTLFEKQFVVEDEDIEGELQITAENFQSGGTLDAIYLALIDKYGQIIGSDSKRQVILNKT